MDEAPTNGMYGTYRVFNGCIGPSNFDGRHIALCLIIERRKICILNFIDE